MKIAPEAKINQLDLMEIAHQIEKSFTSGRLDSQSESGEARYISWTLETEIWIGDSRTIK